MSDYQVPRLAFAWLLFTQALLLLPHVLRFPQVVLPVWLVCTAWRVMIYQGRWGYPSVMLKTALMVLSVIMLFVVQKPFFTVETAILTLLVAFLLKLLEIKQLRDVLIIIYLAYFVIVTELLLSQSILAGIYLVTGLLMVTATLVAIQSSSDEVAWLYPLSQAAKMLLLSLPIMLVAFLVFPRLEPLWLVPMPNGTGKTGVSGSMSPGMFSRLAQSDALAFRVKFVGEVPAMKDLYWRGIVFSRFDGKTWLPLEANALHKTPLEETDYAIDTPHYRYRMIMEPSYQSWIFPLVGVTASNPVVEFLPDYTVRNKDVIDQRQAWDLTSYTGAVLDKGIHHHEHQVAMLLPEGFNPQTIKFAHSLRSRSVSAEDYIQKVLHHFQEEAFFYTLSPPRLGKNSIDDFLFRSRRGFCEHYASAFVVLMRAANIPARVVAGYQGGDINPYEKNVTVRQLDAHAWTEVWLSGKGWIRVDPTYAVAPERIEKGGQESLQDEAQFLSASPFSPMRYRGLGLLKMLQYRFDQANFLWYDWVMNYRGNKQQSVLLALLGSATPRTIGLLVAVVFMSFSLVLAIFFAWRYRSPALSPVEKVYRQLLKKMARKGLCKLPGEGAMDFAQKAMGKWPQSAADIESAMHQYQYLNYAALLDKAEETRLLKQFRRVVIRLKLR